MQIRLIPGSWLSVCLKLIIIFFSLNNGDRLGPLKEIPPSGLYLEKIVQGCSHLHHFLQVLYDRRVILTDAADNDNTEGRRWSV
jgi:hypothetical protein